MKMRDHVYRTLEHWHVSPDEARTYGHLSGEVVLVTLFFIGLALLMGGLGLVLPVL